MKKSLDKTSALMLVIFFLIIAVVVVGVVLASRSMRDEITDNTLQQEKLPTVKTYSTPEELVEEFKNICARGDVEALYDLYYDDYLSLLRENQQSPLDKATFDSYMTQEMQSVMGVDIYMYGDIEMPATQPPSTYAQYIFARVNNGAEMPLKGDMIEDCANLVVYAGGSQNNHFIVKVDGLWYFVV